VPKIMKIGWQQTKLLQKLSGLLFLAHPVYTTHLHYHIYTYNISENSLQWSNSWMILR